MEQSPVLSDKAYQRAEAYQLGKPIREFPAPSEAEQWKKAMSLVRLASFFCWLLLFGIYVGFAALFYVLFQPYPDTTDVFNSFLHNLEPLLFLLIAVILTIYFFRATFLMVNQLVICADGILTSRGKRLEATTWDQITAIRPKVTSNRTRTSSSDPSFTYLIKRAHRSSLTLNSIWGAPVEAHYVQARTPLLLAHYESGAPLVLGKLTLDFMGITRNGRILPWQEFEIGRFVQNPPQLRIFQHHNDKAWTTLCTRDVPSLALVEHLIEQIRTKQGSGTW